MGTAGQETYAADCVTTNRSTFVTLIYKAEHDLEGMSAGIAVWISWQVKRQT